MPLPIPNPDESEGQFLDRCMGDEIMASDYEDPEQRYAICMAQWERKE